MDKLDLALSGGLNAQLSVIGSMLIDDRCVPLVLSKLTPDDFVDGTCRATFSAIRKLIQEGRPVDPVTVVDAMKGGDKYTGWVRETMEITPTAANVESYIPIVRNSATLYRIRALANQILECVDLEDAEPLVRKMSSALSATDRMPRMTGPELAANFWERMNSKDKPKYLPWGIPTADRATYAELGDMILLGGYASSGKTLLSILMAMTQARAGYKVGYYSLETKPEKMADRMFSSLARVSMGQIKSRTFSTYEWEKFAEASNCVATVCPFDVIRASGSTVDDITADALGHGYQVIYVDYVQQLTVAGMRTDNPRIVVTEVSQRLKRFAQSTGTAVVALAQLSRPDKEKGSGDYVAPTMHSFKESGQLEQDADVAFLVWPMDPNNNKSNRMFKVGKNKEGSRAAVELAFYGDTQTMVELAPEPDYSVAAELAAKGRAVQQANRAKAYQEVKVKDKDIPFTH
ncbi:MAG: hypothetical protein K2M42_03405 [Oscillospiraceae bacterium]|nr:hypothetical protein [Oscillospiraceae bacterium]